MVGREVSELEQSSRKLEDEWLLEVEGLSLTWPGHARGYRLKDISFAVRRGEISESLA